jgi:hypothetical protein
VSTGSGTDGRTRPEELANLELLRRQTQGAAHTLNNAFTALLGELALLSDERKGDPLVEEAVGALRIQLERCVRLARHGLVRQRLGPPQEVDVDLGLLASRCQRLLEGTLSRRIRLNVRVPDDAWIVRGDPATLEVLLLTLIHRMADLAGGGCAEVALSLEPGPAPDKLRVAFDLAVDELPSDARRRLVDPALDEDPAAATALAAAHSIADCHGSFLETQRNGDGGLRLSLAFPRVAD